MRLNSEKEETLQGQNVWKPIDYTYNERGMNDKRKKSTVEI